MIIVILNRSFSSLVTFVHCKVSFGTYLPTELARQKHTLAIFIDNLFDLFNKMLNLTIRPRISTTSLWDAYAQAVT